VNDERRWYGSPQKLQVLTLGIITLYIGGILCIWIAAPTLEFDEYPTSCSDDSENCARIAPNPYRGNGDENIIVNGSKDEVMAEISSWINEQPRTQIITESLEVGYVHSVFRSFALRMPDDMLFHVECVNGSAVIWVHSESRLGISDLKVNKNRVLNFAEHSESHEWSGNICEG
tara:strand:- start:1076 stop:1597 length:522 start_codon:yes stop_codon:yes gene_type:complete